MSPEKQDASSRLPSQIDQIHEAEGLIADHPAAAYFTGSLRTASCESLLPTEQTAKWGLQAVISSDGFVQPVPCFQKRNATC